MLVKYNYEDHFELLTMRHEFLKNIENVDQEDLKNLEHIAHRTAQLMYDKLWPNYSKVGFSLDDIKSLSTIYLLGYLSNYGFSNNEESKEKFINKFTKTHSRMPTKEEVLKAQRNEVISFIRQKLQHCSVLCARKARSITVGRDKTTYFAKTKDVIPTNDYNILKNASKYNYRKATQKEYIEAKKKARKEKKNKIEDVDGFELFFIQELNQGIDRDDYVRITQVTQNEYNSTPEAYLVKVEEDRNFDNNLNSFNSTLQSEKIKILSDFIESKKSDKLYSKEVVGAKKLIKKYSFWYGN